MSASPSPVASSTAYRLLPVYLVLDTAFAGAAGPATAAVFPAVRDGWAANPSLSDKLRLGVADAGATAQVRLALCDPLDADVTAPVLPPSGPPAGAALTAVRVAIEADAQALDADGFATHRPLVCVVVGTLPDTTWGSGLAALTVSAAAPLVVLCCVGPATLDAASLAEPALGAAVLAVYTADPALPAVPAVAALTDVLTTVLVRTGHALGRAGTVVLPAADELPAGVTEVAVPDGHGDQRD